MSLLPLPLCHQRSNHTRLLSSPSAPQTQPIERQSVQRASPQFFRRQLSPFASIPPTSAVPQIFFHGGSKPKGMPESGARKRWAGRAAEGRAQPKTGRAGELTPKGDLGRRAAALRRAQAHYSAALCALRWTGTFSRLRCSCHAPLLLSCYSLRSFIGGLRHQGRPDFAWLCGGMLLSGSEADEAHHIGKRTPLAGVSEKVSYVHRRAFSLANNRGEN